MGGGSGAAVSPCPPSLSPPGQWCPVAGEPIPGTSCGGDTLPSPGPVPWARGPLGDGFGSGGCLSSPSPAEKKVSSSPMKAVEGTDMMKAGGCALPQEERSFPIASPSRPPPRRPSARCPPTATTHRSMAFQARGRAHCLFAIGGFVFASTPRLVRGSELPSHPPFHVSAPVSSFASRSVRGFSERGRSGASAAAVADAVPALAAPWLAAGGELAGR